MSFRTDYPNLFQAFLDGYVECALWATLDEVDPEERKRLQREVFEARRLGRDPQRQLCALEVLDDRSGRPLDDNFGSDDIAPEALRTIVEDCDGFCTAQAEDLEQYARERAHDPAQGTVWSYAGHDFFLTRNRHGAGFWDRGLGELGERLTKASDPYGESWFYVGDDGMVYVQ